MTDDNPSGGTPGPGPSGGTPGPGPSGGFGPYGLPSSVAPPPPPPPPSRPFLVRARDNRKLGGVAGGVATAAGLDPTLVRVGMAVGALTGWAILAYLIAWIILPEEDEALGRTLEPAPEDKARLLRIGLAVIAGLGALQVAGVVAGIAFAVFGTIAALFSPFIDPFAGDYGGFNPDFPVRGMFGLLLLVGGGIYLLRRRTGGDGDPPFGGGFFPPGRGGTPPPPVPGGGSMPPPGASRPSGGPAEPGAPLLGRNWRSATEWLLLATRASGWLLAMWFTLAGAVVAALWALDAIQIRFPLLLAVFALGALGLLGTVLVRVRRPALLAAAAAALLVPTLLTLVLGQWNGIAGYRVATPASVAELPSVYRHAAGELRLDLSDLALPAGTTEVNVEMGAGEVSITVPWDAEIEGVARVGIGEFNLLGRSQAGLSLNGEVRSEGEPGAPTIKVAGRVSFGQLKLFRQAPPATMLALRAGNAVQLQCAEELDGLRCLDPDGYATPALQCLVSGELQTMCRPPDQTLEVSSFPGDRTGLRSCSVPAGGGLATCTAVPITTEGPAPAPDDPEAPEAPPAPETTPTTAPASPAPSMPPGQYVCDFPPDGGPATCRPA
ncbi:MAG: PspC domain-containing protein [Acidimicrobiia bacterium]